MLVSGAVAFANAIQSPAPPKPLVSVTVTGDPAVTLVALTVSAGGVTIVNGRAADAPPPGGGVKTVTCAAPTAAISLAAIAACRFVSPTKVVGRSTPFQRTLEEPVKLLP